MSDSSFVRLAELADVKYLVRHCVETLWAQSLSREAERDKPKVLFW